MTLAQVRDEVDSRLQTWWTAQVLPGQITYAGTHGRYWQGLLLGGHLISLPDNQDSDPSLLEFVVPPDESTGIAGSHSLGWKGVFPALPASVGFAARCDEWLSPQGIGFELTVYVRAKGRTYTRSRTYDESKRTSTSDWGAV